MKTFILFAFSLGCIPVLSQQFWRSHPKASNSSTPTVALPAEVNLGFGPTPILIYHPESRKCVGYRNQLFQLVECFEPDVSEFRFLYTHNQLYQIQEIKSRQCATLLSNSQMNMTHVGLSPCSESHSQAVFLQNANSDFLLRKIIFMKSGECLDNTNQAGKSDAPLHSWNCGTWRSQEFLFTHRNPKQNLIPKIVWTYWDQGYDRMPPFYQSNVLSWKQNLGDDWSIHVVNTLPNHQDNYGTFLDPSDIPTRSYIRSKIGSTSFEKKLNPAVIMSDFVRLALLERYGGVWADPSVMLHQDLTSMIDNLNTLGEVEVAGHTTRKQATAELRYADSLENFFMMAIPDSKLISAWKHNFAHYWKLKKPGMSIEDHPMFNGQLGERVDVYQYGELSNYLNQHAALKYTLQTNPSLTSKLLIFGDTSLKEDGPFSLLELINWNDARLTELKKYSIRKLNAQLKNTLVSKFPSENSKSLQHFKKDYFFKKDNLFGQLNAMMHLTAKEPVCPELDIIQDYDTAFTQLKINAAGSQQCLTLRSKNDGGTPSLEPCSNDPRQHFEEIALENFNKLIRSLWSCKCLDIVEQSLSQANIHQWYCHAGRSQQIVRNQTSVIFTLSDLCLEASQTGTIQNECHPTKKEQQF